MDLSRIDPKFPTPRLWVLLLITALVAAGCGSTTSQSPAASQSGGTSSSSGASAAPSNKTLVQAISGDTQTIDPRLNFEPRASEMVANMYDQLVTYTVTNGVADPTKPIGLLATSWDVSADGLTWTWHLRQGVKFHNSGNEMTSADWVYSFQREAEIQKGGWFDNEVIGLYEPNHESDITKAITVVDKYTFQMHMERRVPQSIVLQTLANAGDTVYDSAVMKAHQTTSDPWSADYLKTHDVGTGPFMLDKIEPGVDVTMKRFDQYFLGPAKLAGIVFKVVPSASDRAVLLKNGQVQFAEALDLNTVKSLASSSSVQIIDNKSIDQLFLMMSNTSGPTSDKLVRQAISWAVPYNEIAQNVYFGYAQAGSGPLPKGVVDYDPNAPFYSTDMAKAKQALAASKYPNGFSIQLSIDSSQPQWEGAALLIQSALASLNITVSINKIAPANFNDQFFANKLPFFIFEGLSWVQEPTYHFQLFWEANSYGNHIGYSNPQVDSLLADAKSSTDQTKRAQDFAQVQKLMLEDAPAAWLAQPDYVVAAASNVTGFIYRPDELLRFYTVDLK